eukprot:UN09407
MNRLAVYVLILVGLACSLESPPTFHAGDPLPNDFDWRNLNGTSYVTPVLSQFVPKFCGSACAAHAHVSYISDRIKISAARGDKSVGEVSGGDVVLSVQALVNCAKPSNETTT